MFDECRVRRDGGEQTFHVGIAHKVGQRFGEFGEHDVGGWVGFQDMSAAEEPEECAKALSLASQRCRGLARVGEVCEPAPHILSGDFGRDEFSRRVGAEECDELLQVAPIGGYGVLGAV